MPWQVPLTEEHSLFCDFVNKQWNPEQLATPCPIAAPWHVAPGVPFTMEQLEFGLRHIPALKAVAHPYVPAQTIREQDAVSTFAALVELLPSVHSSRMEGWLDGLAAQTFQETHSGFQLETLLARLSSALLPRLLLEPFQTDFAGFLNLPTWNIVGLKML